jgi:CIC family chloride channel protein
MVRLAADTTWQDIFPVLDEEGALRGAVTADTLRVLASQQEGIPFTIAADVMIPPVTVSADADVRVASQTMLANGIRELPVVDETNKIVGFLDESDVARAYLDRTSRARTSTIPPV